MTDAAAPDSRTFHERFIAETERLCEEILRTTPELQCLAIVPVWKFTSEELAAVLVRWPGGTQSTMTDAFEAEAAVLKAGRQLYNNLLARLDSFDRAAGYAARGAAAAKAELDQLIKQINERKAELAQLSAGPRAESAAPADAPADS